MNCEGSYRDHITGDIHDCEERPEPGERYCRECQAELDIEDPDWEYDRRFEA